MKHIYDELKLLINKCDASFDVPVAAVLVNKNNNIVAKGYNSRFKNKNICEHAEINAINEMFKKIDCQNLSEFVLYSTLKPCKMCFGAIEQLKIKKVYYFVEPNLSYYNCGSIKFIKINDQEYNEYFTNKIKLFFKSIRQ